MAKAKFKWDKKGIEKLKETEIDDGMEKLAEDIKDQAKQLSPKDTGTLANSIKKEKKGDKWTVIADTDYAFYVEMGTRDQPAQPFLRPALHKVMAKTKKS